MRGSRLRASVVSLCAAGLVAACLSGGLALADPASAAAPGWQVTTFNPPAGDPMSVLTAVSCTGTAICVAAGEYGQQAPEAGEYPYMTVARSDSGWAQPETGPLPADASSFTSANVNSIACPAAGSCVAVGGYVTQSTTATAEAQPPFIATESHRRWVSAVRIGLPAGAAKSADGTLLSVTCSGPAACLAIGYYYNARSQARLMSVAETHGTWGLAKQITLPGKRSREDLSSLNSLSCTSSTACVAVGSSVSGATFSVAAAIKSHGTWAWAPALKLPRGSESALSSVSCVPNGHCVAVGWYASNTSRIPMFATLSHDRWSAIKPLPARMAGTPRGDVNLEAVSCTRTFCLAAGADRNLAVGSTRWFGVRISHGTWRSASVIKVPAGVSGTFGLDTSVGGVSCTREGFCAIVGSFTNSHADTQAMAATSG